MNFTQLNKHIKTGEFKPIYYLHGEESYFIDKIVNLLNESVLTETEAAFNKRIFFGPDTTASAIVSECRSFPVMATRRLVIVKEAHRLPKPEIEKLKGYMDQPVGSTVLVLAFKDKRVGLPKKAATAAGKHGVDFHAKKMYERDVQIWTENTLKDSGVEVEPGIGAILVANLGLNISLIENELEKMFIYLKATKQSMLKKELVYEMINVDKAFNVFELIKAIGERKHYQAHMIIDRLTQNTKINPAVLIVSNLYTYFHNLALVINLKLTDVNAIKSQLNVHFYAAKDYASARRHFSLPKVYQNLNSLRKADLMVKGQIPTNMDQRHILKTLVLELLP